MRNNSNKLMIVRASVICFVILTASFTTVIAQDEEVSPKIKVMSFYKWYLHWTNQKHDLTKNKSAMEGYFSAQFTGRIYSGEGQSAGRSLFVDGPQWNDAWAKNVNVSEGAIMGNKAAVKLMLGAPADKTLQITLVKEGSEWKIDGISSIENDKVTPPVINNTAATGSASASGTAAFDAGGDLIIPQPLRQLTTADLAGAWIDGPNRMTTEYVYSGSGKSAGRDTTAFEIKTTFKADGTYSSFFNSVRKKYETESDTKTGPYSINGRLLSIQGTGYSGKTITTTKWVIRGWLELPTMTVLQLAGPWSDNDPIPEVNFTDFGPDSKYRGVTKWVRMK